LIYKTKIKSQFRYKLEQKSNFDKPTDNERIDHIPFDIKLGFLGKTAEQIVLESGLLQYSYSDFLIAIDKQIDNKQKLIQYSDSIQELKKRGVETTCLKPGSMDQSSSRVFISIEKANQLLSDSKSVRPKTMDLKAFDMLSGYALQSVANLYNLGTIAPNFLVKTMNGIQSRFDQNKSKKSTIPKFKELKELRIVTEHWQKIDQIPEDKLRRLKKVNLALTKLGIKAADTVGKISLIATIIMPSFVIPAHKVASAYFGAVDKVANATGQKTLIPNRVKNTFGSRVQSRINRVASVEVDKLAASIEPPASVEEGLMDVSTLVKNVARGTVDPTVSLNAIRDGFQTPEQIQKARTKIEDLTFKPLTPKEKTRIQNNRLTQDTNQIRLAEGKNPVAYYSVGETLDRLPNNQNLERKAEYVNLLLEFAKQNGIKIEIDTNLQPTTGISLEDLRMNQIETAVTNLTNKDLELSQKLTSFILSQTPESRGKFQNNLSHFWLTNQFTAS
jgi:hypothetical protein